MYLVREDYHRLWAAQRPIYSKMFNLDEVIYKIKLLLSPKNSH